MKDNDFEAPFLWFISSLLPEVSESLFNLSSPINIDLKSPHALRSAKDNLKTDGVFHLAQGAANLGNVFDVYHPYWINRKIFFSDHNGSAAFVSACQAHANFGYIDSTLCAKSNEENQSTDKAKLKFMHQYMTSSVRAFRQNQRDLLNQQLRIDKQQIVIEQLMQAVRLLNASIVRLDEHSQKG
jgi:hypothetical protein